MRLSTKHFGAIDVDENVIIDFPEGLPGFQDVKKYIILGNDNSESPFKWLQSIDNPVLAFAVVDPFLIKKDYDIEIKDEMLKLIEAGSAEDIMLLSIVVVPEDISKITMNLKAPVVINNTSKKGIQVILDTDKYSVRHYIMDELHGREVTEDACSDKKKGTIDNNK